MTSFANIAREYIRSRQSEGTRKIYEIDLKRWLDFCHDPEHPSLHAVAAFRDELSAEQKSSTVRRTLASLSAMYAYATEREDPVATWNPFKKVPRPPADAYGRTEAISKEAAEAILKSAAEGPTGKDYAIIRLLYDTGLRRASVASIRVEDLIDREGKMILRVVVKGGKRREISLPDETALAVAKWMGNRHFPNSPWLFPAIRLDQHLHPIAINKIVALHAKRVGVAHAHPHRFRAAYVTAALDAGVPLHEVQASVHHADPKTTLRYDRGQRGLGVTDSVAKFRKGEK